MSCASEASHLEVSSVLLLCRCCGGKCSQVLWFLTHTHTNKHTHTHTHTNTHKHVDTQIYVHTNTYMHLFTYTFWTFTFQFFFSTFVFKDVEGPDNTWGPNEHMKNISVEKKKNLLIFFSLPFILPLAMGESSWGLIESILPSTSGMFPVQLAVTQAKSMIKVFLVFQTSNWPQLPENTLLSLYSLLLLCEHQLCSFPKY